MTGTRAVGDMMDAALGDILALEHMADPEAFLDSIYGFRAQQAVEKLLKAWLDAIHAVYPRIHQIDTLLHYLSDEGIDIAGFVPLAELNSFGVQFRHDSSWRDEAPIDRSSILEAVRALRVRVESAVAAAPATTSGP